MNRACYAVIEMCDKEFFVTVFQTEDDAFRFAKSLLIEYHKDCNYDEDDMQKHFKSLEDHWVIEDGEYGIRVEFADLMKTYNLN